VKTDGNCYTCSLGSWSCVPRSGVSYSGDALLVLGVTFSILIEDAFVFLRKRMTASFVSARSHVLILT